MACHIHIDSMMEMYFKDLSLTGIEPEPAVRRVTCERILGDGSQSAAVAKNLEASLMRFISFQVATQCWWSDIDN